MHDKAITPADKRQKAPHPVGISTRVCKVVIVVALTLHRGQSSSCGRSDRYFFAFTIIEGVCEADRWTGMGLGREGYEDIREVIKGGRRREDGCGGDVKKKR